MGIHKYIKHIITHAIKKKKYIILQMNVLHILYMQYI